MFKDYLEKIYNRFGGEDAMYDTIDIVSDAIEEIRLIAPHAYKKMVCKLEEYLYDIPLEEAKSIVANMSNEYGQVGERWSYEQTAEVARKLGVPEDINRCDFYIVMNMWNMDYGNTMKRLGLDNNLEAYTSFVKDWLMDSDFGEGKVYKYFIKIHDDDENREDD